MAELLEIQEEFLTAYGDGSRWVHDPVVEATKEPNWLQNATLPQLREVLDHMHMEIETTEEETE